MLKAVVLIAVACFQVTHLFQKCPLSCLLYTILSKKKYWQIISVSLFFLGMFCLISSSLRPLDVEFMKALHEKVNIVPVLAKADTLTPGEVKKKKIKARRLHVSSHKSICEYAAECFTCILLTENVIYTLTSDMFFHCFSFFVFADQRGDWAVRYKDIPVPRLRLWWRWRFQATRPRAEGDQSDLLSFFSSSKYLCLVH